ncbi:hypothetical protein AURDEDRAFT_172681 [Auricularia subglabra TFB-10046 SS5]|nr:hypothetical protein AURDEDRAFT_172681 [Auricularia subglabra TFB-10046 SS5]
MTRKDREHDEKIQYDIFLENYNSDGGRLVNPPSPKLEFLYWLLDAWYCHRTSNPPRGSLSVRVDAAPRPRVEAFEVGSGTRCNGANAKQTAGEIHDTSMYCSRVRVHGLLPSRKFRAHTLTLFDSVAWVFSGCDEHGCSRDVYCLNIEIFQVHTATLVDSKRMLVNLRRGVRNAQQIFHIDAASANLRPCDSLPLRRSRTNFIMSSSLWTITAPPWLVLSVDAVSLADNRGSEFIRRAVRFPTTQPRRIDHGPAAMSNYSPMDSYAD